MQGLSGGKEKQVVWRQGKCSKYAGLLEAEENTVLFLQRTVVTEGVYRPSLAGQTRSRPTLLMG